MSYEAVTTRSSKPRSGIALGGLGTGWFELRQDGIFYDFSICNNRPLFLGPPLHHDAQSMLFFVVRFQERGKEPKMRLLQIENKLGAAGIEGHEHYYIFPWLSGVDEVRYQASFPFAKLTFTDADMPLVVELEAYSHFIPHDVKNSALPAAVFRFRVKSKTEQPIDVMIMASLRNSVGYDTKEKLYVTKLHEAPTHKTVEMTCDGLDATQSSFGTMALTSLHGASSHYAGWAHHHPYYETCIRNARLPNLDDTEGRNPVDRSTGRPRAMDHLYSTLARSGTLMAGGELEHTFLATWCFPNAYAQSTCNQPGDYGSYAGEHIEGHYYSCFFDDARAVADYVAENLDELYERTRGFHDALFGSTAPSWLLDQVSSQLNTFVTSSWLTRDKNFGIMEGLNAYENYAGLSTVDVAMYGGVPTAALFPELDRQVALSHARLQHESGQVAHSILRNFRECNPLESQSKRLDLTSQFVIMALRAYFWSEDRDYLETVWPHVERAIEYVLRDRDKNGDLLPDMEGIMCTYDNFPMYGISSLVAGEFLCAVLAASEAAAALGKQELAARYRSIFARGRETYEERMYNGSYYRLYNDKGGAHGGTDEGCLVDQMIGQWAAHLIGLGHILDPGRVRTAMQSILRMNYRPEQGLRNCQWPGDGYLHDVSGDTWIDQANTCWTGVELAFASFLLYEGLTSEALEIAGNVDRRHRRWGIYWDHQEFGGHYFRPMSAWALLHGLLGLSMRDGVYTFAPKLPGDEQALFFAFCDGTAHFSLRRQGQQTLVGIHVLSGVFRPRAIVLPGYGEKLSVTVHLSEGLSSDTSITNGRGIRVAFPAPLALEAGEEVLIEMVAGA